MDLNLNNKTDSGTVLKRAINLSSGSTVTQNSCVYLEDNKKVHIWCLSNKQVLILLEQNRRFIGVNKRRGSYIAILKHYQSLKATNKNLH